MRLISINSVVIGDILDAPIYTAGKKIILNTGATLTENHISKLRQMGIKKVYIKDDRFSDVEPIHPADMEILFTASNIIKESHISLHKKELVDEYPIKDIAKKLVEYIRDYLDKGLSILSTDSSEEYIIEHSLNVALITALLGNSLSYNYNQLCDLVTAAIIHDLGRTNKPDEDKEHVEKGFNVFRKCRGLSLHSSIVCLEHHESFNGEGYPRKLSGKNISDFSRVIRVADLYEEMLRGSFNNGKPLMPHQAFEGVLAYSGLLLDPDIVKHFRDSITLYPNGCTVVLNDNRKGLVIKQNARTPQRPIIRIFTDTEVCEDIDLMSNLTLFIEDVEIL